ncbi:MAG: SIMPL domain-containing protein [Nitrospira sp.]|nr:SIMPL domain-containing protein [Nitrospira sp.]
MKGRTPMTVVLGMLLLVVWPVVAHARDGGGPEASTITVSATGRVTRVPDHVIATFGMETVGRSLADAQRRNHTVMAKVLERLRSFDIKPEHIQTSSFTVTPQYRPSSPRSGGAISPPPEIIGYVVGNTVTVDLRKPEQMGAVIEGVLAAGANQFHGLRWGLVDERSVQVEALKQVVAAAREKAHMLGDTLGVKLGRIIFVNEKSRLVQPMPRLTTMAAMETDSGAPVSPGEIQVEASVTLVYEIAPN